MNVPHPGRVLTELMEHHQIGQRDLARALNVSPATINGLVNERRSVSPDMALRLGRYFMQSAEHWLQMQNNYDLFQAKNAFGARIEHEVKPME